MSNSGHAAYKYNPTPKKRKTMTVEELATKLNLKVLSGRQGLNREITGGYTSDLLSDVMGSINEGMLWITLQTHVNVMAIASLKEVAAIIMVKGLQPEANTMEQSENEGIPILGTSESTFDITGRIYRLLADK